MTLRVRQISTEDISGGAARCAYRLHRSLIDARTSSRMLVRRKRSEDDTVDEFTPSAAVQDRVQRKLRRWRIDRELGHAEGMQHGGHEPFHGDRSAFGPELLAWIGTDTDVVNLHWVARFLDYPSVLPDLARSVPMVWTLHDMNTFTGGCHYDDGCGRFTEGCGSCPQLESGAPGDVSGVVWQRKKALFHALPAGRLHFVTPSRWLAKELRASTLIPESVPIDVIPYGLDTVRFRPIDRIEARRALDVPENRKVILFAAESVTSHRKGFWALAEALHQVDRTDDLLLLSLGKGEPDLDLDVERRHLGFVTDDEVMASAYAAADVFAMPSQEDNLPATVLESLACGTPVAAFDTGGLPDMVRPGETGALARLNDTRGFAQNLRDLVDASPAFRARCREVAVREYPLSLQAERYTALYESLVGAARPVSAR